MTTTNTYDPYGNILSSVNPGTEKTYSTYSTTYQHAYLTNITEVLSPSLNVTTSYTYNFTTGMTLMVKDPMGNVTSYQYDPIDRSTLIKHAPVNGLASNMTFLFQDADHSFGIKNEKANYTDFDYDGLNRVTQVAFYKGALYTSPIISEQNYTYNWQSQMKTFQDPTGNVTAYTYDYLGRLVKVTNPGGTSRAISYDDVNLVRSNYDENGHRTDDLYDAHHRLAGVREYYSQTNYFLTAYTYNGAGALTKTVGSTSQATTYSYDDLNRLVLTVFPDGLNETRGYDSIGNVISIKDPNGKTITYGYDALNRLANVTYPDNTRATYTYDRNGNRLTLSYLGNSATFTYDSRNRETGETWTIGGTQYTISYGYDQVGNLASVTYPDSAKVTYFIDPMNRATTIKTGSTTLATINYRTDSRIANVTYGNNVVTTYHYDNRGRTTEIKVVQTGTTLLDLAYGYDGVGNVVSIGTESYSYDYLNRLTTGTGPWGTIKYGYDGVGNRLWSYQSPTNTTYTYSSYDRLASAGSTSYTYDNNGNRLTSTTGGITTKYNYDVENRLTSSSQGASTLGNYTYSPLGLRIQKIESGITTVYMNQGINALFEKQTLGGTTINDYIYDGGSMIAKLSGSNVYYFHTDILGSTRLVTTGSTTSFSTNYQPFGVQYEPSGIDPIYKYSGRPQDTSTGLYYNTARYYDTSVGRFISRDPENQAINPYVYADNDPEIRSDPSGRCSHAQLDEGIPCGGGSSPPPSGCQNYAFMAYGWFGYTVVLNDCSTKAVINELHWGASAYNIASFILFLLGPEVWEFAALVFVAGYAITLGYMYMYDVDSWGGFNGIYFRGNWAQIPFIMWYNPAPNWWGYMGNVV